MTALNIVHLIPTLHPSGGGPPQVAARLSAAQAALGHNVTLVAQESREQQADVEQMVGGIPGFQKVERVKLPLSASKIGRVADLLITPRSMEQAVQRAHVVHLHGIWTPMLLQAARCAYKHGVPYVVRPAGMLDPWSLAQKPIRKRVALFVAYRAMLERASFIHALNADEATLIQPLGLSTPVRVLPNGVFLDELYPLPGSGEFRKTLPQLGEKPFVLFLSRLHYKKGLDVLLEAFAKLASRNQDVCLVVAGPDEGAGKPFLETVRARGLSDRVIATGALYGRQKYAAMVDAACFCLPSRQEGFSVAITEATACGLPAVISRNCNFPEIETEGAGYVLPLDAPAFADAIAELLADPVRRQAMGEAGRTLVSERFTWPKIAQRIVEEYRAVSWR